MRYCALFGSIGILICAAPSAAQSVGPRSVRWQVDLDAPADCLTLDQFVGMVRNRTPKIDDGGTPETTSHMHVAVSPEGSQVVGRIVVRELDGHQSVRELRGGSCEEVAGALALVAAVVVDPDVALDQPKRDVATPQPVAPPPRSAPMPIAPLHRSQGRNPAVVGGGVGFGAFVGVAPGVAAMPLVFLDYRALGWTMSPGVRVSAGRAFAQHVKTEHGDARFALTSFRGEPCVSLVEGSAGHVRGCGIIMANRLSGEGSRTKTPQTQSRWWVGAGFGPRVGWVVRRTLLLELGIGGMVELTPQLRYYFAPDTTAYRMSRWGAFVEGGFGCQF